VIGDVGGIAVDKHDHIWVYHRPRSVSSTDSGMQGVAGLDAKGKPISALGFARPYGQINGCCMPAPSVLVFDKAGKLLQSWAVRVIRASWRASATSKTVASGLRVSTGSTLIRTTLSMLPAMARHVTSMGSFRGHRTSERFADPEIQAGRHVRLSDGTAGAKGPNSNDTNGGVNGTPEPYCRPI